MVFVFLTWHISLSRIPSRSIHAVTKGKISLEWWEVEEGKGGITGDGRRLDFEW